MGDNNIIQCGKVGRQDLKKKLFYLTFIDIGNLVETRRLILKRDLVSNAAVIQHKVTDRQDIQ